MIESPKRSNLKGPGVCIFCGRVAGTKDGNETVSMSRQHMWPKWLQKPFPKTGNIHTQSTLGHKMLPGKELQLRPHLQKVHQGDIKSRQLKIVCQFCNNRWISALETETMEFLIPLISGQYFTLTEEAQQKFALWLAIFCIVAEYTDKATKAIPEADRHYVYKTRQAPPEWSMWIASYEGIEWQTRYRHHGAHAIPTELVSPSMHTGGPKPLNTHVSSVQIGHLFMHVIGSTLASMWQEARADDPPQMMRLWPIKGPIQWPTLSTLDDATANFVADEHLIRSIDALDNMTW